MNIRKATYSDIPRLMNIFSSARQIMRDSGNLYQWDDSYPSEEIVKKDISDGVCQVLCNADPVTGEEDITAVMAFIPGPDPTYKHIYEDTMMEIESAWPNDDPYHVIHRIAVAKPGSGAFDKLIAWAFGNASTIRIDTHADNVIMHHLMHKHGFIRCGIIRLASGAPRVAYIKTTSAQ